MTTDTDDAEDTDKVSARTLQYAKNILALYYFGIMGFGWAWTEYAQYDCRLLSEKEKVDLHVILWFNGIQITYHSDWLSDERHNAILRGSTEFDPQWLEEDRFLDKDPEKRQARIDRIMGEREKAIAKFRSTYDQMIEDGCTIKQIALEAHLQQRKSVVGEDFDKALEEHLALYKQELI